MSHSSGQLGDTDSARNMAVDGGTVIYCTTCNSEHDSNKLLTHDDSLPFQVCRVHQLVISGTTR
jgi:hypothetical protein